ncbi:MAG: hypothetical protein HOP23_10710 [Methylococcaceae bacterium]|nr:hypothetical protein [Methylococcaceae bacterium]
MRVKNGILLVHQKPLKQTHSSSYSREIMIALLVKFLLLGGLWWLFFAGHKQPVDEAIIAGKLFGEQRTFTHSQTPQERHS